MKQRILVVNSGGDCPGMNAVIRAIVKRASQETKWEIIGSVNGFDGILSEPLELVPLTEKRVEGIHIQGGTILTTNNKRNPFNYPVKQKDGTIKNEDVTDKLIYNLKVFNFDAVIHIGGNESHKISHKLSQKGVNIIGIPKTINNDLSITDFSFGFQTAAHVATEAVDKLVTTANSHNRVLILEVMGRDAGWIALHAAIAGGAEVCLIPEIPIDMEKVLQKLKSRYTADGRGFANIVVAEGAYFKGEKNEKISGSIARKIAEKLKESNFQADIRETILGHLQRGGSPIAFDRILATELGVKAFELVKEKKFGTMAVHQNFELTHKDLKEVIDQYNKVELSHNLIHTAKGIGISFGD
ncbi:MAG: 6-phosphofructokinase [Lutibacter sp.]|uniref:6-phosphofructokinase n=1 Tax=Lutibacter sp. TaxID=1925666 RepID=UPI0017B9B2BA|nr:6-phosphofructokinase [Lutibacter sp.]MBT8317822.1 6-phosphofructokinase [Lutibacter sp.]NNJ58680.1 6-phosphofructokinase [Lutibacter sp.]